MEHDYLFKLLILGDHYTGKSSILHRFIDNSRLVNSIPTIGIDFKVGYFKDTSGRNIKLHFWDTGGHPEYEHIISGYYKNTAAAIIVFDVTRAATFNSVDYYLNKLAELGDTNIRQPILLIGNKTDLTRSRVISSNEALTYAKEHNLYYIETCALIDDNIDEKIKDFLNYISEHYIDNNISHPGIRTNYKTISIEPSREKMDCCIPS